MDGVRLRLGIIDDHPPILVGVVEGIHEALPHGLRVLTARTVCGLLDWAGDLDIVLLDINLNDGTDAEDNVNALVARGWPVILYTQEVRRSVVARCFRAGASGIVGKHEDMGVLTGAIIQVAGGEPFLSAEWAAALDDDADSNVPGLTPREIEALRLYATGLPLKSVARRMGIQEETAKEHLKRVRRKYTDVGRVANTKTELLFRAVEDGHVAGPIVR